MKKTMFIFLFTFVNSICFSQERNFTPYKGTWEIRRITNYDYNFVWDIIPNKLIFHDENRATFVFNTKLQGVSKVDSISYNCEFYDKMFKLLPLNTSGMYDYLVYDVIKRSNNKMEVTYTFPKGQRASKIFLRKIK